MPSTYAHYRMGQEVRKAVPQREKEVIEAFPELFLIGLHGPDILFYYKPFQMNPVNRIGYEMHARAGKEFFEYAAELIKKAKHDTAFLSYLYGVICHFALDVSCHGYVDEKTASSGVSHTEIEVEFDRELMIRDGYDPITHRLTDHIVPSMDNAEVIRYFYRGLSKEQVHKAIKGMITNNNLLIAPSRIKRKLIYTILKVSGNYKEMHGLFVNYEKNPLCEDSTNQLSELYGHARELAISLITEYKAYLSGDMPLNPIYDYTFGGKTVEREAMAV